MLEHYGLTCTVAPTAEPLSAAEVRQYARIDETTDDSLVLALIAAARECCERVTGRTLVTQTWKLVLDAFPAAGLYLPRPPLQSVSSITYLDASGVQQTLAPTLYRVDAVSDPGWLELGFGASWPATYGVSACVAITFVCGYGAASAVPPGIRERLLCYVAHRYDRRADFDQEFCESLFAPLGAGVY